MNSTNKKAPGARAIPQPFNRQAEHASHSRPGVAQQKIAVSAQSVKRPLAPPVYRPQAKPVTVQAKMAGSSQLINHPVAPPIYRPQPVPQVLQAKKTARQQVGQGRQEHKPLAPPVTGASQGARFSVQAKSASNLPLHKLTQKGQQLPNHKLTPVVQPHAGVPRDRIGSGATVLQARSREAVEKSKPGASSKNMLPRAGNSTIQRLTLLSYAPVHNRPGTDVIAAPQHARVAHTGTETTNAAWKSGYASSAVAPGACKHYVAYDMVKTAVFARLTAFPNLDAAVAWLNGLAMLGAGHYRCPIDNLWYPLGAQPAPNIPDLTPLLATSSYSEQTINTEVDDLIKNLANDPRNLYYRANSTGDNGGTTLDVPTGAGQRTINQELNGVGTELGLVGYRAYLLGLGLAV